jgi:hypothetical protein
MLPAEQTNLIVLAVTCSWSPSFKYVIKSFRKPDRFRPVWYCLCQCVCNTLYVDRVFPTSECWINRQQSFTVMDVTSGPSFRNSCFAKEHRSSVPLAGIYRLQLARLKQKRVRSQFYSLELSRSTGTGRPAVVERYRWVVWLDVSRNRADIVTVLCAVSPTPLIRQPSRKLRTHTGAFMPL